MDNCSHFILTRFNVKVTKKNRPHHIHLDKEWLAKRFDIFERFCYPSVKGQSQRNFRWLVCFDIDTPDIFKQKIQKYAEWDQFIPIFVTSVFNDNEPAPEEVRKALVSNMEKPTEYILTTRLDTDDAIAKDFVQRLQHNFQLQDLLSFNFSYGYVIYQGKVYLRRYAEGNPFISLVEKTDNLKGAFRLTHHKLHTLNKMNCIKGKPAWLQMLNENNIVQTRPHQLEYIMNTSIRVPPENLINNFTIDFDNLINQDSSSFQGIEEILANLKALNSIGKVKNLARILLKR